MNLSFLLTSFLSALALLFPSFGPWVRAIADPEPQVIRRTLQLPQAGQRVVELSNVSGDVHIVAEDRSDVSVTATRTVTHEGSVEGAQPDFRQAGDRLLICGDTRRCGCHVESDRNDRWDEDRTRVRIVFEVRVPRAATLDVCTINNSVLKVEHAQGDYTLRNVNGDIEMVDLRGSGRAATVNGDIDATFAAAPARASDFKTVNGRIDVTYPASLAADLRLKTMHGGIYTDFETTQLPTRATTERRDGRFIYRSDRFASVRVGQGGPELTFETLNGSINVRKK